MSLVELLKSWGKYERELRDWKDNSRDDQSRVYSIAYRKGVLKCMRDLTDYINKQLPDGELCPKCKTMNLHKQKNNLYGCTFCGEPTSKDDLFLKQLERMNDELQKISDDFDFEAKRKIRQSIFDLHAIIIS